MGNGSNMWGNDLIISQTDYKCGKWLRDLGNGQNIFWNGLDAWDTA